MKPYTFSSRPRRGFTLIELLVILGIISLLMALLISAVQIAREAARRAQCVNNLKQIGLGIYNYESAIGAYPYGGVTYDVNNPCASPKKQHSLFSLILPFIEETNLYNSINFTHPAGSGSPAKQIQATAFLSSSFADLKTHRERLGRPKSRR